MTLGRTVFAGLCFAALVARGAAPNIEFSGVLTADGKTRVALHDKTTDSTEWVETGSEFGGYEVARYEAKEEAVFLRKGTEEFRLGLVAPKTPLAPQPTGGALVARPATTQAAANAIRSNLRTLVAAARQYQAERGTTTVAYSDLVGPGKFIAELRPIAGENYSALTFPADLNAVSVTMADGATVRLDVSETRPTVALGTSTAAIPAAPHPVTPPAANVAAPAPATPTANAGAATASAETTPPVNAPAPSATAPSSASATAGPVPAASAAADALTPTGRDSTSPSYQVQGGDTWEKISAATGVSADQLRQLNPAFTGSSPPSGQTIRIR